MQAEDEIAGICTAIGATYAGNFAVTTTSGPGLSRSNQAGSCYDYRASLVIVDVQRWSFHRYPHQTEQTDLAQALRPYGECRCVAQRTPLHTV